MQEELLQHLVNYPLIYEYVANGEKTKAEIKEHLMQNKVPEPTARRNVKSVTEINQGMLKVKDDKVWLDKELVQQVIQEVMNQLGMPFGAEAQKQIDEKDDEIETLKLELALQKKKAEKQEQECQKLVEQQKADKKNLKKQKSTIQRQELEKKKLMQSIISLQMNRKVVFAADPDLIPAPQEDEGLFLDDSIVKLDLEKSISKYGGERDSFYNVKEDDLDHPQFDEKGQVPGNELNKENYFLRVARGIMPERFFKKWSEDMQEEKQFLKDNHLEPKSSKAKAEAREAADRNKTAIQKRTEEKLRKNKLSIQTILNDDRMTDQMKLQMYARFSDYRGTEMEQLINFAADYGINANWFIQVMEDADICDSYENVRDCLRMFAKPSEYRKKLDFVRELLDGVWTVRVEYEGEPTLFAFVPVSELNEIRDTLNLPPSKFACKFTNDDSHLVSVDKTKDTVKESKVEEKEPEMIQKPDFVSTYVFKEDEVDSDYEDYGLEPEAVDYEEYEDCE